MANCRIISNSITIYPALPIDREDIPIEEGRRMVNGQLRVEHIGVKKRIAYRHGNLSEADRTSWINAHPWNTSFIHTDELGTTRTMKVVSRRDPLIRTVPAVNGGTNTTGPATYTVEVELEEV
ncbi:MAG: hypothetical protein HC828_02120 [Blastochloris sp.]|nr:hypothetical protein [Blastochloris sp.]